jgi:hypothetical protein
MFCIICKSISHALLCVQTAEVAQLKLKVVQNPDYK